MTEATPLPADQMAHLIVDALHDAGIIAKADLDEAVRVATVEIQVRLSLGNVIVPQEEGDARRD
jgi:hypothetical protein